MPLIGPKEMFKAAYDGHYAIGAFNVNNMEIIQGIMQAAADEKSPVILQVSAGARKYAGQIYIMKLVEAALTESPEVPVCVHLDHGPSFEMCKDCIDGGFTSVMIDGSALPYEENVALTKKNLGWPETEPFAVPACAILRRISSFSWGVTQNMRLMRLTSPAFPGLSDLLTASLLSLRLPCALRCVRHRRLHRFRLAALRHELRAALANVQQRVQLDQPRAFLPQFVLLRKGLCDLLFGRLLLLLQRGDLVLDRFQPAFHGAERVVDALDVPARVAAQRREMRHAAPERQDVLPSESA